MLFSRWRRTRTVVDLDLADRRPRRGPGLAGQRAEDVAGTDLVLASAPMQSVSIAASSQSRSGRSLRAAALGGVDSKRSKRARPYRPRSLERRLLAASTERDREARSSRRGRCGRSGARRFRASRQSKLTTNPGSAMSSPRAATSVATSTRVLRLRNFAITRSRSRCSRSPCSAAALDARGLELARPSSSTLRLQVAEDERRLGRMLGAAPSAALSLSSAATSKTAGGSGSRLGARLRS